MKTHDEKVADYERRRVEALRVANTLPVDRLTLDQAAALLPDHPEWDSYRPPRRRAKRALIVAALCAALWPDAAAQGMTVHVPARMAEMSRREVARIVAAADPETTLTMVEYDGDQVRREAGEVVLIFRDDAPAEWRRESDPHYGAVAAADAERRVLFVFTRDLERALRLNRGDPLFNLALGRVVAHEVEHIRRGRPGHDETGWFRACPRPEELKELGWGPRKAEGRR